MRNLENKTALITSATKGIGLACALKLAERGAFVYMGVRRVDAAHEICERYEADGYRMAPVFFDALQKDSYEPMVAETIRQAGRIDILVNNFGIGKPAEDLDLVGGSEEAFWNILDMNLGSVYRIAKLVIPHMQKQGGGSIVNISSVGGLIPDVTRIGYGVSKASINNITKQIALQYARSGIRCNAVLPGLTATDAAMKNMPESFLRSFLSHVPLNRMAEPEDIANAVAFFAGSDSSYITGHILDVAGGYGLGTPQYADMMRSAQTPL
ncbi:7alpha-hydroxysteroid dehydrogenase [Bacilliculturomica massiliensis]|uniref:7alpha-hydroxysteroid dehydrogenase n=1 Tax=Bacilliculturomica massiliensis TaxID=1917867 RepID=UPI0010305670|nr:SDR family oxidoreductase [Bacilliculturomica massiliensis]